MFVCLCIQFDTCLRLVEHAGIVFPRRQIHSLVDEKLVLASKIITGRKQIMCLPFSFVSVRTGLPPK